MPLLTMHGMVKSFPGVKALQGVNLMLHPGEVLAVLGENGAGKSTLMKILGGAYQADEGEIAIDGKPCRFLSPQDSRNAGVAIIYQEFNLVPGLTASENIFLGQEQSSLGLLNRRKEQESARNLFQRLGVQIGENIPVSQLTTAQQQAIEIAKALSQSARIIVMDEPTAALTSHETEQLFEIIRELRSQGIGIIYISHRLEEIFALADRISILRDGKNVDDRSVKDFTREQLIESMVGRKLENEFPERDIKIGSTRLEVKNLNRGNSVQDVSFSVRKGEILALTGLVGAGRTETVRLIFGADRRDSGSIEVDGRHVAIRNPRDAIAAGIGLLTEDRKLQGLVLKMSVRTNYGLPNLNRLSRLGFVQSKMESKEFGEYVNQLKIKIPQQEQLARNLSGGNQQKVVLAKWLARNCDVLIFDEPTRGIDVGAKFEIYLLMNQLAADGKAIVMISSELPEVLGMSDRILVMREGKIKGEIEDARTATQEQIMRMAVG